MDASPPVIELASALSVAVRIEPELIRAVQLELFPYLGVETEADLWFSELVRSRGAAGLVLKPEDRRALQARLGEQLAAEPAGPLHRLWDIVARVHARISPALLLEEQVTWLAVSGQTDAIDAALAPALKAVVAERREGVAQWFLAARDRLPEAAQQTATAWKLAQAARSQVPSGRLPMRASVAPVATADLADIVHLLGDVPIGVRRVGEALEIGALGPGPDTFAITVPDTSPRVLTLLEGRVPIAVAVNAITRVTVGPGPVHLQTARGLVFELPASPSPTPTPQRGRFIGVFFETGPFSELLGTELFETFAVETHRNPTRTQFVQALAPLEPDVPFVLFYNGQAQADERDLRLRLRDTEIDLAEVASACFRSGSSQVLILIATDIPKFTATRSIQNTILHQREMTGWSAVVFVNSSAKPAEQLHRLLTNGPSDPELATQWSTGDPFITGEDLCTALKSETESPVTIFPSGTPRAMFRNPLSATTRVPTSKPRTPPPEVPGAPLFFLSHRAARSNDPMVTKFFADLSENVAQLVPISPGVDPGFMDRSIRTGAEWGAEVAEALGTCQTFIPLLSPNYFNSVWCGMEWYAFSQRRVLPAESPQTAIIPVIWTPSPPERAPQAVRAIQRFTPTGLPDLRTTEIYHNEGILGMLRLGYESAYQAVVWRLGQHIADMHNNFRVEPHVFRQDELRNAFDDTKG